MILIGGASAIYQNGRGAFQEENQVETVRRFCKYAHAIESPNGLRSMWSRRCVTPSLAAQARRTLTHRTTSSPHQSMKPIFVSQRRWTPPQARSRQTSRYGQPLPSSSRRRIRSSSWAKVWPELETREFVERTQLPYLATPMGKGVVPDDHPLSVAAARTFALQNTDLVVLLGAASTGFCISAFLLASARMYASSSLISLLKRSARTWRLKWRSSETARR